MSGTNTQTLQRSSAAAVRTHRMPDVMDSSGDAAAELQQSSPSTEPPAPSCPSPTPEDPTSTAAVRASTTPAENTSSTTPAENTSTTPAENTIRSVRRTVVDVGVVAGPKVISGAWLFFRKFDKPVNKKRHNTQCQVKEGGKACGRLYKHLPGNGTSPLLDHLKAKHPEEYKEAMESSNKSREAKSKKGRAFAEAAHGSSSE